MCLERTLECQRKFLCHLIANWRVTSVEIEVIQTTIPSIFPLTHLGFAHIVQGGEWAPLDIFFPKLRRRNHAHHHPPQKAAHKTQGEALFPSLVQLSDEWSCRWHITFAAYIDLWLQSAEQTSHFFKTDHKQLLIIPHLICRKSRWANNLVCCSITLVGHDATLMLLCVQLLCSCWISCAVESAQLKKNEPHHLSRACSKSTHSINCTFGAWHLLFYMFCSICRCASTESLHPVCAFTQKIVAEMQLLILPEKRHVEK